jgi:LmbE family N-acetylglucosaminyl deacetylase
MLNCSRKSWVYLITGSIFVLILAFLLIAHYVHKQNFLNELSQYQDMATLKPGDRLTIVSPHLDDESLGIGGLMSEARRMGISVSVIFMTNGDGNRIGANLQFHTGYSTPKQYIQSGIDRQQEAYKALAALGVNKNNIYFLGLPDGGLSSLLLPKYLDTTYRSPETMLDHSTYSITYIKNLAYTGKAAQAALEEALKQTNPTRVFVTAIPDHHPDHAASGKMVTKAIQDWGNKAPALYYFMIHYPGFPQPGGVNYAQVLLPPKNMAKLAWQVIPLTSTDLEHKIAAVKVYRSQTRIPELGGLMFSLIRQNELVLPASILSPTPN